MRKMNKMEPQGTPIETFVQVASFDQKCSLEGHRRPADTDTLFPWYWGWTIGRNGLEGAPKVYGELPR